MTSAQLAPAIFLPLVAWRVYVRVRRNVGPQLLEPKRLKARVYIFAAITLLFAVGTAMFPMALPAFAGGVAGSVALAWLGVRLTTFQRTPKGDFYTPNTIIGVGLSLLLVARLAYRFTVIYEGSAAGSRLSQPTLGSPLTVAILGLMFGYYVAYYIGVLARAKHLDRESAQA
jgi:hypothetical protein